MSRQPLAGRRAAALLVGLLAFLGLLDAFWLEPQRLLLREDVDLDLGPPLASPQSPPQTPPPAPNAAWTAVHLSDLHVVGETPLVRRLLGEVAAVRPDFIVISGDLVRDDPDPPVLARHTAARATFLGELRRIAPVWAIQGHSEHQGAVTVAVADSGARWLSNEGTLVRPAGAVPGSQAPGLLLLGLNQQVGEDDLLPPWTSPFAPRRTGTGGSDPGEGWVYSAIRGLPYRSFYSHYDPVPTGLADASGPLAWSGYDVLCDVRVDDDDATVGVVAHSRFVLGEDRMIRFIRDQGGDGRPQGFFLTAQGADLKGHLESGVDPEPGRWYRLRLRTRVTPTRLWVGARVWPAGGHEPAVWQATAEDRSPHRLIAGTMGLWAAGGGTADFRKLEVIAQDGTTLLDRPLDGPTAPAGFRVGTRASRIALALARSPKVPPGTPRVVLAHTPEPALQAADLGLEAVLVGHTHGGQVRIPFLGPLTTRSRLGLYYDRGRFELAAPNARGWTWLYIQPGVGTSLLPIRSWCPPSWTVLHLRSPALPSR